MTRHDPSPDGLRSREHTSERLLAEAEAPELDVAQCCLAASEIVHKCCDPAGVSPEELVAEIATYLLTAYKQGQRRAASLERLAEEHKTDAEFWKHNADERASYLSLDRTMLIRVCRLYGGLNPETLDTNPKYPWEYAPTAYVTFWRDLQKHLRNDPMGPSAWLSKSVPSVIPTQDRSASTS